MGPRLLKAMEVIFEGPIITTPPQNAMGADLVSWLDIVEFAKARPGDFNLITTPSGNRCCQFYLKGAQVEISEDDWRVIVSGTLDRNRLIPPQPLEEDETAELATLEILEQRLKVLIKKADEVAGKARQLNYHLSGRKAAISSRRSPQHNAASGSGFQAVNQPGPSSGPNHHGYDLHADLLQQFLAHNPANRLPSIGSVPPTPNTMPTATSTPRTSIQQQILTSISNRPSPGIYPPESGLRDPDDEHRALVTAKVEKLARGDEILPPCDRCRRLKTQCIKHLTACQGCTKKHARCVWKGLTEEEVAWLKQEAGDADEGGEERRERGPSVHSVRSSQQDPNEPRRGSDRSEDAGPSRSMSRIVVGRTADDIWRMGSSSSNRRDSMEVDVDPRDTHVVRTISSEPASQHDARSRDPVMLSRLANAASAAADGSILPSRSGKGGP